MSARNHEVAWTDGVYATRIDSVEGYCQVIKPLNYRKDNTVRAIIVAHGQAARATSVYNKATFPGHFKQLVAAASELTASGGPQFIIASYDVGGPNGWANDTAIARMGDAWTDATVRLGAKTDKAVFIGFNMGFQTITSYARANLSKVKAIGGVLPFCDTNALLIGNRGVNGLGAGFPQAYNVQNAYGARLATVTLANSSPTYTDAAAVSGDVGKRVSAQLSTAIPANTKVLSVVGTTVTLDKNVTSTGGGSKNIAIGGYVEATHGPTHNVANFASQLSTKPVRLWVANDDQVCPIAEANAVATASGGTVTNLGNVGDHSETSILAMSTPNFLSWLAQYV